MAASIVKFALVTGLRRGEIFKLKRENVDLEHGYMTLKDPKGNHDEVLPLSAEAVKVLKAVPCEYETPYIFYGVEGGKRVCVRNAWESIREEAKLPPSFRFHGLRHHFGSSLVSNGVSIYSVQKLLTHKDVKTTQRYAHLSDESLKRAVSISDDLLRFAGDEKVCA